MSKLGTGLFFYTIGKAMSLRSIMRDGTVVSAYGKGRVAVATGETFDPHTTVVYTRAELVRALVASGRSIATMDVVRTAGLEAYLSTNGKGRGTIAELLVRRDPEFAESVIALMSDAFLADEIDSIAA